jgi:hypothetical protein
MSKAGNEEGPHTFFDNFVVCECKSSVRRKRPWVVFTDASVTTQPEVRIRSYPATPLGVALLKDLSEEGDIQSLALFSEGGRLGYAAATALGGMQGVEEVTPETAKQGARPASPKESNVDVAFAAIASVLGAAKAKSAVESEYWDIVRMVIPVVVINTPLFECFLDRDNDIQVISRDEMIVLWRNPGIGPGQPTVVHVVKEEVLPNLVKRISDFFQHIRVTRDEILRHIGDRFRA